MTEKINYFEEWEKALQIEIQHLKKYGSNKYRLSNGNLLTSGKTFSYYFETTNSVKIPVGSSIRLEWGNTKVEGRLLSSEGGSVIIALQEHIGDLNNEAFLYHDPWELLEELIVRLVEVKKSKRKQSRVLRLMDPSMPAKQPDDDHKSNVHKLFYRSKYNPVTFVWGPPGTGKTYTLARVAANKYLKEKRVLILSHSNQAVDVLLTEIVKFLSKKDRFKEGDTLRYGSGAKENISIEPITTNQLLEKREPQLAKEKTLVYEEKRLLKQDLVQSYSKRDSKKLLDMETKLTRLLEKIRQKEMKFLKEAQIIGTTLAKAATDSSIYEKEFDLVIIDEASMSYVPQTAFAASLGKRVIICGDFKQLPPIAASRHPLIDKWLREDIFHRSGVIDNLQQGAFHPHLLLLKEQRRMHPDISMFTNKFIYASQVYDHPKVGEKRKEVVSQAPFPEQASVFVDTSFTGEHCLQESSSRSKFNLWQLLISFQLIHEAYLSGTKSIGYVTPYRAQATMMECLLDSIYQKERHLADIIPATVHRFQGSERDVMIFDSVDSFPQTRPSMLLTGKDSERLINVAITRTRGKFIHVSDKAFIQGTVPNSKTLRQLVDFQIGKNQQVTTQQIGTWIKNQHTQLQWVHALKKDRVFADIQEAKTSIILSYPKQNIAGDWTEQLRNRSKKVKLTLISKFAQNHIHVHNHINDLLSFPFVIIDEKILWLGFPLEGASKIEPPFVAIRLDSKIFIKHFFKQLPINLEG